MSRRLAGSALVCLVVGAPGVIRAQVAAQPAARAPRLAFSLAGGTVTRAPLGVSRQLSAHGLAAVAYTPRRGPVEVRAHVLGLTEGADGSVGVAGVLPVARAAVAGGALRPYLLAGVGAYGAGPSSRRGRTLGGHAGAGVRLERGGYGGFGELRRHGAYDRTLLSLGVTLRR